MDQISLIKINQVVGNLYLPEKPTKKAIIFANGGPALGDQGNSNLWSAAKENNYILFIPDYIGHSRSDGEFNFKNCLETIFESEKYLKEKFNCTEIILVGNSWGGAIVPFLEKYQKSDIKTICLVQPLTNWITQGKTSYPEEDVIQIDREIKTIWKNIYRGYADSEWPDIFLGKLKEFNPIDNLELLKDKQVFIYHGKQDSVIHFSKSQKYYQKFKKEFPKSKVFLKKLNGNHSNLFIKKALDSILKNLTKNNKF